MIEEKKVGDDERELQVESHAHHTGILKSVLERAVANRFSSKPIDMEKNRLMRKQQQKALAMMAAEEESNIINNSIREVPSLNEDDAPLHQHHHQHYPALTPSEHAYLENLLESEDPESIRQATLILSDRSVFPREDEETREVGCCTMEERTTLSRRDSKVQRLFFRMHELGRGAKKFTSSPIHANNNGGKRRLGWNERKEGLTTLESQTSMSSLLDGKLRNSILMDSSVGYNRNNSIMEQDDLTEFDDILEDNYPDVTVDRSGSSTTSQDMKSWLDGNNRNTEEQQQQQVMDDVGAGNGVTIAKNFFKTSFAILGTTADDASCYPHVLSPPLMESLLEFVPETLTDYHFWIKYSMVRDGASLYTLLRHARASTRTILAIETTDGQVFGSFTSQPWKLVKNLTHEDDGDGKEGDMNDEECFFGSNDTFLWKMRQSRFESQALVRSATVEQAILMESELAVYPYTASNNFVQHCSTKDGIGLGENAAAIRLDPSLRKGSTAPSEAFANPCLIDPKEEHSKSFEVANVEVWALTPHDNVKEAEHLELTTFFQRRQQEEGKKKLDLFGILVGGPKRK